MSKNISGQFNSISKFLMRPVDASTLGAFRFLFGIILVWESYLYISTGEVKSSYLSQKFHFSYEWFPWITPWPGDGMYYHFGIMGVAALFLALGLFYRLSAVVFFLSYTYMFLMNKAEYNNHYYFICLLGFLLCFVNADRWMSLDSLWRKKIRTGFVPYWNVLLLKAQVFIVYFYGGIAKITPDWLRGEPLRHWLQEPARRETTPALVAKFLESEFATYFFSYGGLLFDLGIGFLLIWRKTRLLAFGLILLFNLTNHWLFHIGIFPLLMIAATILFVEPETPRKWLKKLLPRMKEPEFKEVSVSPFFKKLAVIFVGVYLAIQVLLPLRHWLYKGNVSWTEEGHNFSWHMKLRSKYDCRLRFLATNPETGETWRISAEGHIFLWQYVKMCMRPHMIIQFAHFLGGKLEEQGIRDPIIKVKSLVSLNFRPPQILIDPEANLMEKEYSTFSHADWIVPLKED